MGSLWSILDAQNGVMVSMSVICEELVRAVNSGRCFALVGAGASCDLGMPSWRALGQKILEGLDSQKEHDNIEHCRKLLDKGDYPSFFSLAEKVIGKDRLLALISEKLSGDWPMGRIYQYISSWPFQSYLTTNFDDQLSRHLEAAGFAFAIRLNTQDDMRILHSSTKDVIFKIHSDPKTPEHIVLTAEQYAEFRKDESRKYWRDKIFSLLSMVDVVVIGYSASDPDFRDQLSRLEAVAAPDHPIFMFATGFDPAKVREYYPTHNIRIIPYDNEDGTHRDLQRVLARYDPFIAKRGSPFIGLEPIDENAASLASSIYLFTQLRIVEDSKSCFQRSCAAMMLEKLSSYPSGQSVSIAELKDTLAQKTFAKVGTDPIALQKALEYLYSLGFISLTREDHVTLEPNGRSVIDKIKAERILLEENFEHACRLFLKRDYSDLDQALTNSVIGQLRKGLVRAFEKRGMEIARSAFSDMSIDVSDAADILGVINQLAGALTETRQRAAFADLMMNVILKPSQHMKSYLAALSQGYFAYHALGLEPRCSDERLNIARKTDWLLDSSVILPLLAIDCLNHEYAKDLLNKLKELGLRCYTTRRFFDEVQDHALWALRNFSNTLYGSVELLHVAMAGPGYKENLFISGFVKWGAKEGRPSLPHYMAQCLGPEYAADLRAAVANRVTELGIKIRDLGDWSTLPEQEQSELKQLSSDITALRKRIGTYRNEAQCDAEAEAVTICKKENVLFLSPSTVLNRILPERKKMSWNPEAMYRFLTLFSSIPTGVDPLYECMTQSFFNAGFDIVDTEAISYYAAPLVRQARMTLAQEKATYVAALGKARVDELEDGFERTSDAEKPFYSMQFALYIARQESKAREVAEERARIAEREQTLSSGQRREYERLKAKAEEKARKHQHRKRRLASRKRGKPQRK